MVTVSPLQVWFPPTPPVEDSTSDCYIDLALEMSYDTTTIMTSTALSSVALYRWVQRRSCSWKRSSLSLCSDYDYDVFGLYKPPSETGLLLPNLGLGVFMVLCLDSGRTIQENSQVDLENEKVNSRFVYTMMCMILQTANNIANDSGASYYWWMVTHTHMYVLWSHIHTCTCYGHTYTHVCVMLAVCMHTEREWRGHVWLCYDLHSFCMYMLVFVHTDILHVFVINHGCCLDTESTLIFHNRCSGVAIHPIYWPPESGNFLSRPRKWKAKLTSSLHYWKDRCVYASNISCHMSFLSIF